MHECQNKEKFEQIDKRITKVEKNIVELQARLDKKHDELTHLHRNIEKENTEIITLITAMTEMTTIQKELNKDTEENSREINKLKSKVLMQQSSFNNFKWIIGLGTPILTGLILAILLEGLKI